MDLRRTWETEKNQEPSVHFYLDAYRTITPCPVRCQTVVLIRERKGVVLNVNAEEFGAA